MTSLEVHIFFKHAAWLSQDQNRCESSCVGFIWKIITASMITLVQPLNNASLLASACGDLLSCKHTNMD